MKHRNILTFIFSFNNIRRESVIRTLICRKQQALFLKFLIEAVLISLSGVMAPGPMTAVTLREGGKSPHAGALISIGHGVIEIPLMILIFAGFTYMSDTIKDVSVHRIIGIVGGLFLLLMSGGMLISLRKKPEQEPEQTSSHTAWISGMILSAANPYFLVWWATVGAALTLRSADFGLLGFILFAGIHWLCDFVWLYLLSFLSYKGSSFFGEKFQKSIALACALVLLYFGLFFIIGK